MSLLNSRLVQLSLFPEIIHSRATSPSSALSCEKRLEEVKLEGRVGNNSRVCDHIAPRESVPYHRRPSIRASSPSCKVHLAGMTKRIVSTTVTNFLWYQVLLLVADVENHVIILNAS